MTMQKSPLTYFTLCLSSTSTFSAEGLDKYLTTVQHHHEQISQREERKIRSDAAFEEAKRKEKTILLDKKRQEKLKTEVEVCCQLFENDECFFLFVCLILFLPFFFYMCVCHFTSIDDFNVKLR